MFEVGDWVRAKKFNPAGWDDNIGDVKIIHIDKNGFVYVDIYPTSPYCSWIFEKSAYDEFVILPDPLNTLPRHQCKFAKKINDDPTWENCCKPHNHGGKHRTYFEGIK